MSTSFDVSELSHELAQLRSHPHLRTFAVVVPIAPERRELAQAAIAEGPPFDPAAAGLARHEILLTGDEAIFLFELADGADSIERILASEDFWSVVPWWEDIAIGRPRLAASTYAWIADGER